VLHTGEACTGKVIIGFGSLFGCTKLIRVSKQLRCGKKKHERIQNWFAIIIITIINIIIIIIITIIIIIVQAWSALIEIRNRLLTQREN
jgi:hypothetical protein